MADTQIDILKTATDWAKAEMMSSGFFVICGILFILISLGFWQMGKTDTAKAYIIPLMVAGGVLIIIGAGLVISNMLRLSDFPGAYSADSAAFLQMELARADKTISGYHKAIYIALPAITFISAGLLFVVRAPVWQASMVAIIAMMAVILMIDTNATARMQAYKATLAEASSQS